jgi:hypothetical protein
MMQAGWWTGIDMEAGPMSIELWVWLQHVDEAWDILERSGGTWLDGGMVRCQTNF